MAKKKSSRLLWLLVVGFLVGGGGALAFEMFWGNFWGTPDKLIASGREAYGRGLLALESDNPATAALELDKAQLQANRALDMLEQQAQKPESQRPDVRDALKQQVGQAFWLKAAALRDRAYARASAEGEPLAEVADSSTGEKFRSILRMPTSEDQQVALRCLRGAALILEDDGEVQQEALRTELMLVPLNWPNVIKFARNRVEQEPADVRARYMLARFKFDQPEIDSQGHARLTPLEKRDRGYVLEAREQLEEVKKAEKYPLWRTLYLEAQVTAWLRDRARKDKDESAVRQEDDRLQAVLLDPQEGALARASRGEALEGPMSTWDVEGVFGLLQLALVRELEAADKDPAALPRALGVLDQGLAFCQARTKKGPAAVWAIPTANAALEFLAVTQPRLQGRDREWGKRLEAAQEMVRSVAADASLPAGKRVGLFEAQARLLTREAHVEGREGDSVQAALWRKEALKWVEQGLRAGKDAKVGQEQLAGLHTLALELKGGQARTPDLSEHLAALERSGTAADRALAHLYRGMLHEQAGRLEKARSSLARALGEIEEGEGAGVGLRAHILLGGVELALGRPGEAQDSLRRAKGAYDKMDQLSEVERSWLMKFIPQREDLVQMLILAHLESAYQAAQRHHRRYPGQAVPRTLVKLDEEAVNTLLKELPVRTPQRQAVRLAVVRYYTRTGRPQPARDTLKALRADHPESVGALREEVALVIREKGGDPDQPREIPEQVRDECDRIIQKYLDDFPNRELGKLFKAQWLVRTDRPAEAVAFLEDVSHFPPGSRDQRYHWALALAVLAKGDRERGAKVLRHLPDSPEASLLLIHLASNPGERDQYLEAAQTRYERQGLFLCWEAEVSFGRGEKEEAARGYFRALEYTQVKPLASFGLGRALFSLAQDNPNKARELTLEMIDQAPDETVPYLGHAFASLLLDDMGNPDKTWEEEKTMATALDRWERVAGRTRLDGIGAALVKAEFWGWANQVDRGYAEVLRALGKAPNDARALRVAIQLALASGTPGRLGQAEEFLADLRKVQPNDPRTALLAGRLHEQQGRTAEAIRTYEELLGNHPQEKLGYHLLLELLAREKATDKMREWVQRWKAKMPREGDAVLWELRHRVRTGSRLGAGESADVYVTMELANLRERLVSRKDLEARDPQGWEKHVEDRTLEAGLELRSLAAAALAEEGALQEAEARARRIISDCDSRTGIAGVSGGSPRDALDARLVLGLVHVKRGEWEKARDAYREVLARDPRNISAGNNLTWILTNRLGDPEGAYRVAREVRKGRFSGKLLPGDRLRPDFLDTLGDVYRKLGRKDVMGEMRELFEVARNRYPHDPRMYLHLGRAYEGLDEPDKARNLYRAALALAAPEARTELSDEERQAVIAAVNEALSE